jgi:hypothetical protein
LTKFIRILLAYHDQLGIEKAEKQRINVFERVGAHLAELHHLDVP